jgi:hypothetical protein
MVCRYEGTQLMNVTPARYELDDQSVNRQPTASSTSARSPGVITADTMVMSAIA